MLTLYVQLYMRLPPFTINWNVAETIRKINDEPYFGYSVLLWILSKCAFSVKFTFKYTNEPRYYHDYLMRVNYILKPEEFVAPHVRLITRVERVLPWLVHYVQYGRLLNRYR